jgi:hypothetical protein
MTFSPPRAISPGLNTALAIHTSLKSEKRIREINLRLLSQKLKFWESLEGEEILRPEKIRFNSSLLIPDFPLFLYD